MTRPVEQDHSYDRFAMLPLNREIDRILLDMAPGQFESHTDLATGSGAVISRCSELGKYKGAFWNATGVDIDPEGLAVARDKFVTHGDHIRLIQSPVQNEIPGIATASQDLVTMFNAIHLTDPVVTFGEAARIAKPGATLLVSSAYEKSAMPSPAPRMLGIVMANARKILEAQGYTDFPKGENLLKYSNDEYKEMVQAAGFTDVEIVTYEAQMDRVTLEAIFNSRDFALGALPGIDLNDAAAALVASIDPMLKRFGRETLPRNYMLLKATRAGLPQA